MAAPEIRIPGIVISAELDRGVQGLEYRAVCGGRTCLVRFAPECGAPERENVFRAFRTDMIALARARHSTIAAVLEMGLFGDRPYAVMESPEGETLAERLRWGPLPEPTIVTLGARILGGLLEVHRRGLVHGNLTPARIVFVDGDEDVRIVGFGSLSRGRSSRKPLDYRGDLTALGRVLYECATGRAAFAGLTDDPRGDLTELPELSGGNEPLTSPELSALVAGLVRCASGRAAIETDALLRDFERLQTGTAARSPSGFSSFPPSVEGLGSGQPDEVPLVGRTHHVRAISEAWNDVRAGGSAIVHVRGAPGSGKTRLVRNFLQQASSEPTLVLKARCTLGDTRPFATLAELLNDYARNDRDARRPDNRNPESVLRNAGLEMAPLLKRLSPELALLFGGAAELGAPHELQALFAEGVPEFLTRLLQAAGPAILAIDDLQWMDAGSRAVLTRVADRARGSKTLFLFTSRADEPSAPAVELFFRPIRALRRIDCHLEPLGPEECRRLVEAHLGTPGVPSEVSGPLITLGDGTPMSILEVLHAITGEGLLVPFWGNWRLDRDGLERMQFPTRTREILARRVSELSANTRRVMGAAAVLGSSFDEAFLARIVLGADCASALGEARDARVLVRTASPSSGDCRFVHETVREALLSQMGIDEIRAVHQRIAENLDADGGSDTSSVCRRAAAYAAGDWERAPDRVFATNYEAGLRAFSTFDNERALSFLTVAEKAAVEAEIDPDPELHQTLGEIYVRRGALTKGREYFERVLERPRKPLQRGITESRIAWVDYTMGNAEGAWRALERAFAALSHEMPRGGKWPLARAILSWKTLRREIGRERPPDSLCDQERMRIEALCAFHYQSARLAVETDDPARFLAHVLQGIEQGERLGPSRALVRSLLAYAFTQVSLGFRSAGLAHLEEADAMAKAIGDPVSSAYLLQMRSVIMGWAGDLDAALDAGSRCLLEKGHWLEVSEYCLLCTNQSLMLGIRGQAEPAWQWIAQGIDKIRHELHATEIRVFLEQAARAALATLGRDAEVRSHFEGVPLAATASSGAAGPYRRFAFGPRVRAFTETGHLDSEFEALVDEVRSLVADPARAHLVISEFYVHVAHARVHQLLRAGEDARRALLPKLARSVVELAKMARVPILAAHRWVVEGCQALFQGSFLRAALLFSRADDLAQRENCPWVLYAVARGRAHLHLAQGRDEAALAQATLAAATAEAHGYAYRLQWIREEFPLLAEQRVRPRGIAADSIQRASVSAVSDRRLDALLQVGQVSPIGSNLPDQVKRILDELLERIHAECGVLFLSPEGGGPPAPVAGRHADGRDLSSPGDGSGEIVRNAFQSGQTIVQRRGGTRDQGPHPDAWAIASPLMLGERVIGAVYLEASQPLSDEDVNLLEVLSNQSAVAIELTRALRAHAEEVRERKLLEDELRQAQKMEAIGRLAGTIAHDFNNLLAIITATLDCVQMEHGDALATELTDIREASEHAVTLTSQLLTFARRQASTPRIVPLNGMLASAMPLVRRLLPESVELVSDFHGEHDAIVCDPNRVEQILLNLAANARDAMPGGGRLTIATRDAHAAVGAGEQPQDCLLLTVEDTGQGMSPEVLRQAFEPFFTTKFPGKGTGLGLATVYGIVQQMRGRITVDSVVGKGTIFSMYFPRAMTAIEGTAVQSAEDQTGEPAPRSHRSPIGRRPETILLVEDERLILTALERGLIREGYRVLPALSAEHAIDIVQRGGPPIDAIVTDVLMPGMTGPQLLERLDALGVRAPHLFISGSTDDALAPEPIIDGKPPLQPQLLQKPFTVAALVERIRQLLDTRSIAAAYGDQCPGVGAPR